MPRGLGLAWLGGERFCLSLSPCLESFGGLASGRRPLLIPTGTQAGTGKPVPNRVPAHTGDLRLEVCTANLFH